MDIFEEWAEHDYNPFIIFNTEEKVIYVNQEAQFLLGYTSAKEIFKLASSYASLNYGYKTTIIDIEYGRYSFYAITVGYKDDNNLGIKLYKKPSKSFALNSSDGTKVNIYSVIDLSISSFSTQREINHKKLLDPTFPEIYLKVDEFLKLLGKVYLSFKNCKTITTKLSLLTGEYVIYEEKKYPILSIEISSQERDTKDDLSIRNISSKSNTTINLKKDFVQILLPMVT